MGLTGEVDVPKAVSSSQVINNNFTIGQDFASTKDALHSIFRKEYPNHGVYARADIARPPRLGDVMHADDYFNNRASETASSFEYRSMKKPVLLVSTFYCFIQ